MPDKEQNSQKDFMIERIKTRPINRRKLFRRTVITAVMAVIFGLIASFTFLVLMPVINNLLYPEEETPPEMVTFPEDQEEMSPEDMLAENLPTESPESTPTPTSAPSSDPEETSQEEEQRIEELLQEFLSQVILDRNHYSQMYKALRDFVYNGYENADGEHVSALNHYMVTVRGITSNVDWFDNVQESSNQASGLVVADNGRDLLILVDYTSLQSAESLVVDLDGGFYRVEAELKGLDVNTNLAVVGIELDSIPENLRETGRVSVANLGTSNGNSLVGTPVIALGRPMGTSDSIGYGMITSASTQILKPDRNYRLLLTDINGSRDAEGVLFNLQGQVVGIITGNKTGSDMANLINAYGISEIKKIIQKLSNQAAFAYLGITGVNVTSEAHQDMGVPYGAYVTELEMDSPAMLAGIQAGDVITVINDNAVASFSSYTAMLMDLSPGQTVQLTVMRQAQGEYREMSFSIELAELVR